MCYQWLKDSLANSGKSGKANPLLQDESIALVMREFEKHAKQGFPAHPKMSELKKILIQHFTSRDSDLLAPPDAAISEKTCTRAMIFANHRATVQEIVRFIETEAPFLKPTQFVGQGSDKKGNKGLAQREQLDARAIHLLCWRFHLFYL